MIYLLKAPGWNGEVLLKIGYAENVSKRFYSHKTSNPCIELLDQKEGSLELESLLHKILIKYRYKDTSEWYIYDEEVINTFRGYPKKIDTIIEIVKNLIITNKDFNWLKENKLDSLIQSIKNEISIDKWDEDLCKETILRIWKEYNNEVDFILDSKINELDFNTHYIIKINSISLDLSQILGRQCSVENPWKNELNIYFKLNNKEKFNNLIKDKEQYSLDLLRGIELNYHDFKAQVALLDQIEKNVIKDKYKSNYISINITKEGFKEAIFNNLVMIAEQRAFDTLIDLFEIEKIKFQPYSYKLNSQSIDPSEEIYNKFQVGERYNKPFIKSELKKIYDSLGYKKTPKATDLEEWFIIRYIKYMDNGKKINGFEIIDKKL